MSPRNESRYDIVMLIDDNEIDNMINQKMLESVNFAIKYQVHTSGKGALDNLGNLLGDADRSDQLPDMILLDINMPLMDGFQFLEELSVLNAEAKVGIDVCMLTTSINPSDRERAQKIPEIKHFLTKPLTTEQLKQI